MGAIAGIGSAIAGAFAEAGAGIAAGLGLGGTSLLGVGTGALIGDTLEGVVGGGLLGGIEGAATGQPILRDAALGALGGGISGIASPLIGAELGLGATASGALGGGLGGFLSSEVGGTNPLTGALTGAVGGALSGSLSGEGTSGGGTATTGTGGTGALSAATVTPDAPLDTSATPTIGGGGGGALTSGDLAGLSNQINLSQTGGGNSVAGTVVPSNADGLTLQQPTPATPLGDTSPPGTTQATPTAGGGSGGVLSNLWDSLTGSSNPAGGGSGGNLSKWAMPAIAGAGLLYNMTRPNTVPGMSAIQNQASALDAQAAQLQNYVTSGTLPPGVQSVLSQVQQGMQQQIKAKYAQFGMSGSTSETQDLNNAALTVQSQGAQEAINLMNQGTSLANLGGQLMTTLLNAQTQQNNAAVQSIGNLATALAGGGGKLFTNTTS